MSSPTSNSNLELPKLVLCFCQKLSGLMMRATWMQDGNDSWRIFSKGLMLSHLEPRMSTMTVKPCLATSSLRERKKEVIILYLQATTTILWQNCWNSKALSDAYLQRKRGREKKPLTYSNHLRFPLLLTRSPAAVWLHKRLFLGAKGFNLNRSSEEAETEPPALTHSDLPLWKQITHQNKSKKRVQGRERGRRSMMGNESKLWRRGRRKRNRRRKERSF